MLNLATTRGCADIIHQKNATIRAQAQVRRQRFDSLRAWEPTLTRNRQKRELASGHLGLSAAADQRFLWAIPAVLLALTLITVNLASQARPQLATLPSPTRPDWHLADRFGRHHRMRPRFHAGNGDNFLGRQGYGVSRHPWSTRRFQPQQPMLQRQRWRAMAPAPLVSLLASAAAGTSTFRFRQTAQPSTLWMYLPPIQATS